MQKDGQDLFKDYLRRISDGKDGRDSGPPYATITALIDAFVVFEAAARLADTAEAADELRLTPETVRRHLDTLEAELGLSLFSQQSDRLDLTANGTRLADAVREALRRIADAVEDRPTAEPPVTAHKVVPLFPARAAR